MRKVTERHKDDLSCLQIETMILVLKIISNDQYHLYSLPVQSIGRSNLRKSNAANERGG